MGEHYLAIADVDAQLEESAALAERVIERLALEGVIESVIDPHATLTDIGGYRVANKISDLYDATSTGYRFWEFQPSGVEVIANRWVNCFGVPQLSEMICPGCNNRFRPECSSERGSVSDQVVTGLVRAMGDFVHGNANPAVPCPICGKEHSVKAWVTRPHLGFSNLAFVFWNWPAFDSSPWRINVPEIISQVLRHSIIVTYGKV